MSDEEETQAIQAMIKQLEGLYRSIPSAILVLRLILKEKNRTVLVDKDRPKQS